MLVPDWKLCTPAHHASRNECAWQNIWCLCKSQEIHLEVYLLSLVRNIRIVPSAMTSALYLEQSKPFRFQLSPDHFGYRTTIWCHCKKDSKGSKRQKGEVSQTRLALGWRIHPASKGDLTRQSCYARNTIGSVAAEILRLIHLGQGIKTASLRFRQLW